MKKQKKIEREPYIYIRLDNNIKDCIKARAKADGCNMTIWIRQLIIRELDS